jgi:acetate---CoA ligase (ADP-forming)
LLKPSRVRNRSTGRDAIAPSLMAQSAGEAAQAAEKLGYPCVLKVASADIRHKTEFGALRLGLENRTSAEKA